MHQRNAGTAPTRRAERKEATRQQLIAATIDCIAASGFAETTLSKVSERAKVSRGLVNFHFESKDQLLIETLRHLTQEYLTFWRRAVEKPEYSPAQRLVALIQADFHPQVCNRKKIAVWYAFWGEAKSRPIYMAISAKADGAFAQMLESLCTQIVLEGKYDVDPDLAARGLRSLIDGQWLELLLSPASFDRERSKRLCRLFAHQLFPKHIDRPSAEPGATSTDDDSDRLQTEGDG
ncbi:MULTISPECIES: TetR family transcriptional regulator C-terminal domain-containing protein [Limibacillus]|jgi:TetR/AcrR family transcriptional repressor of bet genes|uniref:TetR/AcrR family transcriptional repressor of bet genes n=1 Tax=Limibacillus halophilus TaxID=1579333 RepID=A0A839SSZ3_9PROT|nr:TetR family transcriptional regulator C-terminal domain-containing protein [Limibacillus halophilus]MBB3064115.1 TetR/AcrR family transcriptional repressor of bet genes [Limibacillus halophilus]